MPDQIRGTKCDERKLEEAVAHIRTVSPLSPNVAVVLGSGLGDFATHLPDPMVIPTKSIPHYPVATVEGHKGEILISPYGAKVLAAFRGRVHYFESGSTETILFPIRVAIALGVKIIVLTNAAGGVNRKFQPGDLMVITDQLNLTGSSAPGNSAFRQKFADIYDPALFQVAFQVAEKNGLRLQRGIYAGVKGPSYETAAEIEMIHRLRGDAVGMSTVIEAEAARSLGARVLGISCITNKATGTSPARLDHSEVTLVANRVKEEFAALLKGILETLCT
jgi:purine-nucleoside phosphorylase